MENWITGVMEQFGYIGILFLIAIENVFPPIPSEVILTFGGFMTTYTSMTVTGVVIASTFGSVLGAAILYGIGYLLNVDKLEGIIDKDLRLIVELSGEGSFEERNKSYEQAKEMIARTL